MNNEDKLAIDGGKPIRDSYLPYGRQWIDEDDIQSVVNVLKSDYLTTGPIISMFERKIAEYVGSQYAVAFSSGTAALHAACFAAGISDGDEVITTPMTFAASANCVLYQGGKPVFADINPLTYNIDPKSIEQLITKKTKAIIPVDFTGEPADLDEIRQIADKYHLTVIEDAAHALGADYKGKKVGSLSDMTMFSLHPVKNITTGEGGVITTNNQLFYEKMIQFRTHGITRELEMLVSNDGPWYYEMQSLGYNYRITDIQAALGISQLTRLDSFNERRKCLAAMYNAAFCDMDEIDLPYQNARNHSSWHLYIIRLKLEKLTTGRKEIFEAIQKENIGVNVHYIPVYFHPFYQNLDYQKGLCPNAEKLYGEMITLPLFPLMTESDIQDVIRAVKKVIWHYSIESRV